MKKISIALLLILIIFSTVILTNRGHRTILPKLSSQIPLTNYDGSYYKISSHQFRHTDATEIINKLQLEEEEL